MYYISVSPWTTAKLFGSIKLFFNLKYHIGQVFCHYSPFNMHPCMIFPKETL